MKVAILEEPKVTAEQIHKDFHAALSSVQELLHMRNNKLGDELAILADGHDLMSSDIISHFSNVKEVVHNRSVKMKLRKLFSSKGTIDEFLTELATVELAMPYKLINYSSIDKLCNKYGLVIGLSTLYKETLPEKNAKEIQNFIRAYQNNPLWQQTSKDVPLVCQNFRGTKETKNLYIAAPLK